MLTCWRYDKSVGADNGASALLVVPHLVLRGIAYVGLEFNRCIKFRRAHSCYVFWLTGGCGARHPPPPQGYLVKVKYRTGHWAHYWLALEEGTRCKTHGVGEVQWHAFCAPLYLRSGPRRHAWKEERMWKQRNGGEISMHAVTCQRLSALIEVGCG